MPTAFRVQLSFDAATGIVQTRVIESDGGFPRQSLPLPLTPVSRRAVLRMLETPDLALASFTPAEQASLCDLGLAADGALLRPDLRYRGLGKLLYNILFPASNDDNTNVHQALTFTRDNARRAGRTTALQLRFDSDAVSLAELPWELICDPADHFPVKDGELRLTRYITYGRPNAPLPVADRLDILVVSPRPEGVPELPVDAEAEAIALAFAALEAAGKVRLLTLPSATLQALKRMLAERPYDVVHFDGHGALMWQCPACGTLGKERPTCTNPRCPRIGSVSGEELKPTGLLAFESDSGDRSVQYVTADELQTALTGAGVRLFVASACQTARVDGATVFSSVGPALIDAGIPAVVAMQFSVPVDVAATFVTDFYTSLARRESIARAVALARKVLAPIDRWHIPALYLQNRDGEGMLFGAGRWAYLPSDEPLPARPPDAAPYKSTSPFEIVDAPVFFGREAEGEQLVQRLLDQHVAVLAGPADVGKTSLVNARLIPDLLGQGIPAFALGQYEENDPVRGLRRAVGDTPGLEDALDRDDSLKGTVRSLALALRPATGKDQVAVIFDGFEQYLMRSSVDQRAAFFGQVADLRRSGSRDSAFLLFVVAGDCIQQLWPHAADVPELNAGPVTLGWLGEQAGRDAIEGPLRQHPSGIRYDPAFLDGLLADLKLAQGGEGVSPLALQIVCSEFFDKALALGAAPRVIDARLAGEGSVGKILADYIERQVQEFPPEDRKPVRGLMRCMVSPAGEREYGTAAALAAAADLDRAFVQDKLDGLLAKGLLNVRTPESGPLEYSLAYRFLADRVAGWFDAEAAEDARAKAALGRAWQDWSDWLATLERKPELLDGRAALVDRSTLAILRDRRSSLQITGPQACLLLRSAVAAPSDVRFWARELAGNDEARALLTEFEAAGSASANGSAPQAPRLSADAALAAQALGLTPQSRPGGLPAAAVAFEQGKSSGIVRHSAALALASLAEKSLGLEQIRAAESTLWGSRPKGKPWRGAQALAQMKVAGFIMPDLAAKGKDEADLWTLGIRMWDEDVIGQCVFGGLGAMSGAAFSLLVLAVVLRQPGYYGARAFILMPICLALGVAAIALAEMFAISTSPPAAMTSGPPARAAAARIIGFVLGFVLALVALWVSFLIPIDTTSGSSAPWLRYLLTYVVGGSLWALGIAMGRELGARRAKQRVPALVVGGGLGGAAACLLIVTIRLVLPTPLNLDFNTPLIGEADLTLLRWVEALAVGFGLGAGLAAGWEVGARLWRRLRLADQ